MTLPGLSEGEAWTSNLKIRVIAALPSRNNSDLWDQIASPRKLWTFTSVDIVPDSSMDGKRPALHVGRKTVIVVADLVLNHRE